MNVLDGGGESPKKVLRGPWTRESVNTHIQAAFAFQEQFREAHGGASPMTGTYVPPVLALPSDFGPLTLRN